MADHQETFDQIDSASLFESAMSNEPEAQAGVVVEQVAEQPRSEDGKYAAKVEAEPVKEPIQAEPGKDKEGSDAPPSWRLREMREERDAERARAENASREAAQFRAELEQFRRQNAPKPEPVDIFADPNAWAQEQLSPIEQRMQNMQTTFILRASRAENVAVHGRDAVAAAENAIGEAMQARDPEVSALRAKMLASDDPVGVAVEWHKSRSVLKETGGDLTAYREKALEDALNDPAFLAKALERANASSQQQNGQPAPKNVIKLPPSVGKIAAAQSASADGGDMSNESLFANAMR
jgi:hypothetical protein